MIDNGLLVTSRSPLPALVGRGVVGNIAADNLYLIRLCKDDLLFGGLTTANTETFPACLL